MMDLLSPLLLRPIRMLLQNWMWWGLVLVFLCLKRTLGADADGYLSTDTVFTWGPGLLSRIPGLNTAIHQVSNFFV
ncbi:MAG: hypothetical protein Q3972_06400 [Corynebacterium sp.]|nr:hypothetical protein [Corynebacterium sp.]